MGVFGSQEESREISDSMDELAQLVLTAGATELDRFVQVRDRLDPAYLIGRGKVEEVRRIRADTEADLVIFDNNLSPAQLRNLEQTCGCKVVDRTQLILDIFAQRAETREAKLQIELAQLDYLLPRLTGRGKLLSRLGGGIGTRGPGEQKLEYQRRHIRERIARLRRDLEGIRKSRSVQRKKRVRDAALSVAIVGYTNAGKSSLLNVLCCGDAYVADKLFATLDPRTRRLRLSNNNEILFSDTVGFIRKLPHTLVAAFRATLEEVIEADLLLLVADASHPMVESQIAAVHEVLAELKALTKPIVTVFNKIDLLSAEWPLRNNGYVESLLKRYPNSVALSSVKTTDFSALLDRIVELGDLQTSRVVLRFPLRDGRHIGQLYREGRVVSQQYLDDGIEVEAELRPALLKRFQKYLIEPRMNTDKH